MWPYAWREPKKQWTKDTPCMVTRDHKEDLNLEEALLPIRPRSKIHRNNTEYKNAEKSYNVKNLSRLLRIYHVEETNHGFELRTGVAKTKANMMKWGYQKEPDILCECGEDKSDDHLLQCTLAPPRCKAYESTVANEKSIAIATRWLKQNI